jgi:hypothetical protein
MPIASVPAADSAKRGLRRMRRNASLKSCSMPPPAADRCSGRTKPGREKWRKSFARPEAAVRIRDGVRACGQEAVPLYRFTVAIPPSA